MLRDILGHQLTKTQLLAVVAVMADFTGSHRPIPGQMPSERPVLVLASEHDRAFAKEADAMRAVYPDATFHTLTGAGHGALFTHTDAYIDQVQSFLTDPAAPARGGTRVGAVGRRPLHLMGPALRMHGGYGGCRT